jgi:hypothetical protein
MRSEHERTGHKYFSIHWMSGTPNKVLRWSN